MILTIGVAFLWQIAALHSACGINPHKEISIKSLIVTSLKKEEDGRSLVLEMLEECVEAELNKENICW